MQKTFHSETKTLLLLALPLMLAQFADAGFGFFSTMLLAHLGNHALAAGGLVWSLFVTILVLAWGILSAVSVIVAQQHGANNLAGVSQALKAGLVLAALFSIPDMLLLWHVSPILLFFGQQPETVAAARTYLHVLVWSLPADFYSLVLIQFAVGLGRSRVALFFNLTWVILALLTAYILMFGKLGFSALGIAGTGWGVTIGINVAAAALAVHILWSKHYRPYLLILFKQKYFAQLKKILTIGVPLASMYCLELAFFMAIALLMGSLGSQVLAANQIAIQYIFLLTSVFSFSMAQAITVKVGHYIGGNNILAAKQISYIGLIFSTSTMTVAALIFWFFPQLLIGVDLNIHLAANQTVINYAKSFLAIAAIFQIFEAVRIAAFGALRGLGETRFSMLVSLFTFWCIAFPVGYYLAVHQHWGGKGMWWSMVLGAVFGAGLLIWRLRYILQSGKNYE